MRRIFRQTICFISRSAAPLGIIRTSARLMSRPPACAENALAKHGEGSDWRSCTPHVVLLY